jgi:hypothetical protein
MVFLLRGLPPFLARAGPKDLGGRDRKGMVGTLSIGPRKQVCGLPSCPEGTDISASTTQVEMRISSSLFWNPKVHRPRSVRSLGSGSSLLAVAQSLACLFPNPQGCCQDSSAWP